MPLDLNNPWDNLDSPADSATPKLDISSRDKMFYTTDCDEGRGFTTIKLEPGALVALDFGWIMIGREQFQPRYRSHFVPLGTPLPSVPAEETWTPALRIGAWVENHGGLRVLSHCCEQ